MDEEALVEFVSKILTIEQLDLARQKRIQNRVNALVLAHMSYRAAAVSLEIDHAYLQRLAKGDCTNPGDDVLRKLGLL